MYNDTTDDYVQEWKADPKLTRRFKIGTFPCSDCGDKTDVVVDRHVDGKRFRVGCTCCDIYGDSATTVQQAVNNWDEAREKEQKFWDQIYNEEHTTVN